MGRASRAKAERRRRGDCFEAAAHVVIDATGTPDQADLEVCHGIATGADGTDIAGIRYAHAWVERDLAGVRWAIDRSLGKDVEMPARMYYHLGRIDPRRVIRYDPKQLAAELYTSGHYGPWHPSLARVP